MWFRVSLKKSLVITSTVIVLLIVLFNLSFNRTREPLHLKELSPANNDSLSLYLWKEVCAHDLDKLRELPGFPIYPDKSYAINYIDIQIGLGSFGTRIYGYFLPNKTALYQFKIETYYSSNTELWLSSGPDPRNVMLIAKTIFDSTIEETLKESNLIPLEESSMYYLEVLHILFVEGWNDRLSVYWRTSEDNYKLIGTPYFAPYRFYKRPRFKKLPCHYPMQTTIMENSIDPRDEIPFLKYLPSNLYLNQFPVCSDQVYQLAPKEFERYTGLWNVFEIEIFVSYSENINEQLLYEAPSINIYEAKYTLQWFTQVINTNNFFNGFTLVNLEKTVVETVDRYLIEGKVNLLESPNQTYLFSQYIFIENDLFCIPKVQPNLNAFVHIVIIIKDQSRWLHHFLENINRIYEETNDEQFGVFIVDFNSEDINVGETIKSVLKIRQYKYIFEPGNFNKVMGQNIAIDSINNPKDIIFTCDLHLDIPTNLINTIRKHSIEGISVFAPILRRLDCGVLSFNGNGRWEDIGYGLISMYKSDWVAVGGMNSEYGVKWGGEDWELIDRVKSIGYHVDRLRIPGLVHFHHAREGTWYQYS